MVENKPLVRIVRPYRLIRPFTGKWSWCMKGNRRRRIGGLQPDRKAIKKSIALQYFPSPEQKEKRLRKRRQPLCFRCPGLEKGNPWIFWLPTATKPIKKALHDVPGLEKITTQFGNCAEKKKEFYMELPCMGLAEYSQLSKNCWTQECSLRSFQQHVSISAHRFRMEDEEGRFQLIDNAPFYQ